MGPLSDPIWETVFAVATWSVLAFVAISVASPWVRLKVADARKKHAARKEQDPQSRVYRSIPYQDGDRLDSHRRIGMDRSRHIG
jgi:hypothetical protein